MTAAALNRTSLPSLPTMFEPVGYDVRRVTPGIVHIGLGGFHRAHMARYTHDLLAIDADAFGWGIVGAGLRADDSALMACLTRQDGLYTLVEREGAQEKRAMIGSIVEAIDASASSARLLAAIDAPATRIVSITVTENGYHLDRATKRLDLDSPAIVADLADPTNPRTVPGLLVEALRRRRAAGRGAFTALSCDNIQHNGTVLRNAVLAMAASRDPALAEWIAGQASFPSSMVDRITPVPTGAAIAAAERETGIADGAALSSELFRQWVIEDRFVAGRPAWEKVGVQFVEDVTPYEFMKLRLLNASHLAICAPGQVIGHALVSQTIGDPLIRRYMTALMDRETGPTLMPVPGVDLAEYKRSLIRRFANPAIEDTTQRVNTDAPVNYLVEPIRDRLAQGRSITLLALGLAAWCHRLTGQYDAGVPIRIVHPMARDLAARAIAGGDDPRPVLAVSELFGPLGEDVRLIEAVAYWLGLITRNGMAMTMRMAADQEAF